MCVSKLSATPFCLLCCFAVPSSAPGRCFRTESMRYVASSPTTMDGCDVVWHLTHVLLNSFGLDGRSVDFSCGLVSIVHIVRVLQAEACYRDALSLYPNHPGALGNLAALLHRHRRAYAEAETLYKRAAGLYPEHATILTKYGNFVKAVGQDTDRAQELYELAIRADPANPDALGSLAVLLHGVRQDFDAAEAVYERAAAACPYHTNNLSNFALFLADVRQNYDRAEAFYQQALATAPSHANVSAAASFFFLLLEIRILQLVPTRSSSNA